MNGADRSGRGDQERRTNPHRANPGWMSAWRVRTPNATQAGVCPTAVSDENLDHVPAKSEGQGSNSQGPREAASIVSATAILPTLALLPADGHGLYCHRGRRVDHHRSNQAHPPVRIVGIRTDLRLRGTSRFDRAHDASLISGQSNAVATDFGKDEPTFRSDWIRTFGSMSAAREASRYWSKGNTPIASSVTMVRPLGA